MEKKIKIWHISSNPWRSAITEYACSVLEALGNEAYEHTFVMRQDCLAEGRVAVCPAQKVLKFKSLALSYALILALRREWQQGGVPALVFLYEGKETAWARFLSWLPEGPRLVRFRGRFLPKKHGWAQIFFRWSHSHIDLILTPNSAQERELRRFCRTPVHAVPLGRNPAVFHPVGFPEPNARPLLLVVGRLDPVKGHMRFLALFKQLLLRWPPENPKPLLQIVGEPQNIKAEALLECIQSHDLREDVQLDTAWKDNVPTLMSQATLGIIPSLWSEEICRVAEEFLLCGTPIFVSTAGALRETLTVPGAGDWYDPCHEEEALVKLAQLLVNCVRETQEDRVCRAQRARQMFSLEVMKSHLERILLTTPAVFHPTNKVFASKKP